MQQKRLRFSTLLLCLLLPLIGQLQAQTIDLGDFANPSSYFDQSVGQTAPFDFDYLSSVTQQSYTAVELQGSEGKFKELFNPTQRPQDGNVCLKSDVALATSKHWVVYYADQEL